jgi:signal transduction histidine kinase
MLAAAGIAIALSILVEAVDLDPSLGNRRFHASLETADALVLVFVAAVLVGRLRIEASRRNLLLVVAIVVLAMKNLFHAGATMVLDEIPGGHVVVWGTALNGFLGAALLAAAAVLPDRPLRRRPLMAATLTYAVVLVVGLFLVAGALEPILPEAFKQLPEEATELELLSGHPVKIIVDLATAVAYALAAIWFSRLADDQGDEFMKWLSIGSVVAAIAFLNYALFPSRFTQLLYGGEILWLGAIFTLLYGAVREISNTEAELVRAAVLSERRRVARDLHDGVAQELAYLASQTSWYLHQPVDRQPLNMIRVGVERALEESRAAIAALTRPLNEPLDAALGHAAIDVGDRLGVRVDLDLDREVEVTPEWRDALTRIAREAVSNAARHGGARNVDLCLRDGDHVSLRVVDNGSGFDPDAPRSAQSFGLMGMRERTESLGGEFTLESKPGSGTTIEVRLP